MSSVITWQDIALRLTLAIVAGGLIGLNRGEHGLPAGLRTTLLVCLAACLSMIQANILLASAGKPADSFAVMDVMRLPLGILSGMGFIGGGVILKRENLVLGVTTAATLWFVTALGLCFGGGQIALGIAASVIGIVVLRSLKTLELKLRKRAPGHTHGVGRDGGPDRRRTSQCHSRQRVPDRFDRYDLRPGRRPAHVDL